MYCIVGDGFVAVVGGGLEVPFSDVGGNVFWRVNFVPFNLTKS